MCVCSCDVIVLLFSYNVIAILQPDYDDHVEETRLKPFPTSRGKEKSKDNKKYGMYILEMWFMER